MAGARWRGAALAMSGPTVPAEAEAQPETTRVCLAPFATWQLQPGQIMPNAPGQQHT